MISSLRLEFGPASCLFGLMSRRQGALDPLKIQSLVQTEVTDPCFQYSDDAIGGTHAGSASPCFRRSLPGGSSRSLVKSFSYDLTMLCTPKDCARSRPAGPISCPRATSLVTARRALVSIRGWQTGTSGPV